MLHLEMQTVDVFIPDREAGTRWVAALEAGRCWREEPR